MILRWVSNKPHDRDAAWGGCAAPEGVTESMPPPSPGSLARTDPATGEPRRIPQEPHRVLHISYDGMLEPLGESQVVGYLERLSSSFEITLLSFEKPGDLRDMTRADRMAARLSASGIRWIPLRYHKQPPVLSTALDIARGIWHGLRWSSQGGARLVHARGYVPAVVALPLQKAGAAFLFDMRGFWVDERVEAGQWPRNGGLYRAGKWFERLFFQAANAIVSLTHAGVRSFPSFGYATRPDLRTQVIATCVDLELFHPGPKDAARLAALGLAGHTVIGCVGTMSNWYLRRDMLEYLALLWKELPRVKILIVTREDLDRLRTDALASGLAEGSLVLRRADFTDMPDYIRLMDAGVFFINACFSKRASAATKLGEFLACGVPVIINDGVGDSGAIVREGHLGVVLPDTSRAAFAASLGAVRALLGDTGVAARCRAEAERDFNLERGAAAYRALYEDLLTARRDTSRARRGAH